MSAPTLEEYRAGLRAVQDGLFRTAPSQPIDPTRRIGQLTTNPASWVPAAGERVWLVVGAHGGAGATTVALLLAEQVGSARVVGCAPLGASGLVAASFKELGERDGRLTGQRGQVAIERCGANFAIPAQVPIPTLESSAITIVDAGWPVEVLVTDPGWLGDLARGGCQVVLVAQMTRPGLRRLECCLGLFDTTRCIAMLVGAGPKKVESSFDLVTRRLHAEGRVFAVPESKPLGFEGISSVLMPTPVIEAAAPVVKRLMKGNLQ
jgi:hypothetical protein